MYRIALVCAAVLLSLAAGVTACPAGAAVLYVAQSPVFDPDSCGTSCGASLQCPCNDINSAVALVPQSTEEYCVSVQSGVYGSTENTELNLSGRTVSLVANGNVLLDCGGTSPDAAGNAVFTVNGTAPGGGGVVVAGFNILNCVRSGGIAYISQGAVVAMTNVTMPVSGSGITVMGSTARFEGLEISGTWSFLFSIGQKSDVEIIGSDLHQIQGNEGIVGNDSTIALRDTTMEHNSFTSYPVDIGDSSVEDEVVTTLIVDGCQFINAGGVNVLSMYVGAGVNLTVSNTLFGRTSDFQSNVKAKADVVVIAPRASFTNCKFENFTSDVSFDARLQFNSAPLVGVSNEGELSLQAFKQNDLMMAVDEQEEEEYSQHGFYGRVGRGVSSNSSLPPIGMLVEGVTFQNNDVDTGAGGVHVTNVPVVIKDCTFKGNRATIGGVYAYIRELDSSVHDFYRRVVPLGTSFEVYMWVDNCTFEDNRGVFGALSYTTIGSTVVSNSTFTLNHARSIKGIDTSGTGGAISSYSFFPRDTHVLNSVFTNNTAEYRAGSVYFWTGVLDTDSTVTLDSCTFNGGSSSDGGQVLIQRTSNFLIDRCNFTSGSSELSSGCLGVYESSGEIRDSKFVSCVAVSGGGAVKVFNSTLVAITRSTFLNNQVTQYGGGLLISGDVTSVNVTSCVFEDNRSKGSAGALSSVGSPRVRIKHSIIKRNSAVRFGGGLLLGQDANVYMYNVTIEFNESELSGGGMAFTGRVTGEVVNCTVQDNVAEDPGGGAFLRDQSRPVFIDCLFHRNFAGTSGGGLKVTNFAMPVFHNCTFTNNHCDSSGAGFAADLMASPTFEHTSFLDNTATSYGGAGYLADKSNTSFSHVSISGNETPNDGGGLYLTDAAQVFVTFGNFTGNNVRASGAAVLLQVNTLLELHYSVFSRNTARSAGGALMVKNNATLVAKDCELGRNSGSTGGALFLTDFAQVYFDRTQFNMNSASSRGGAIWGTESAFAGFSNCTFTGNFVVNGEGGAVANEDAVEFRFYASRFFSNHALVGGCMYLSSNGTFLRECEFEGNTAQSDGGVIAMDRSARLNATGGYMKENAGARGAALFLERQTTAELVGTQFIGNVASKQGGAVGVYDTGKVFGSNLEMLENEAPDAGALYVDELATVLIEHTLIANNTAKTSGGGIHFACIMSMLTNVTLYGNRAGSIGGGIFLEAITPEANPEETLTLINCHIMENEAIGGLNTKGGGLYIQSSGSNSKIVADNVHAIRSEPSSQRDEIIYTFANATIERNKADTGGGVFYDFPSNRITFGPQVLLRDNEARGLGGAMFINEESIQGAWMHNASFVSNNATFAGGSVAWKTIPPGQQPTFCANCNYTNPHAGYQTEQGFATAPLSSFFGGSTGCPGSQLLDSSPYTMTVILIDGFGNQIRGPLLAVNDYNVTLSHDVGGDPCKLQPENVMWNEINEAGAAEFGNLLFKGKQNDRCVLQVRTTTTSLIGSDFPDISCNITLGGCSKGSVHSTSDDEDTCEEEHSYLVIGLSTVVILLFIVLFLTFGTLLGSWYLRRRRRQQWEVIPDFEGKPQVSLMDLLKDPAIPRIDWDRIEKGDRIGAGASGWVVEGRLLDPATGVYKSVALKQLITGTAIYEDKIREFLTEIKLMSALHHDNIVEFLGISQDGDELYLVTELMERGNLRKLLDQKGRHLTWEMRLKLLRDIAKGMAYLHRRKIIHRDLKPQNLLINKDWVCKIVDFGISTVKPQHTQTMTVIGTPKYMAPEVLANNKYGESSDVFSFGVLVTEVYTGEPPYQEQSDLNAAQLMYKIVNEGLRPSTEGFPRALAQLVDDCVCEDPKLRPSFDEIVVRLPRLASLSLPGSDAVPVSGEFSDSSVVLDTPTRVMELQRDISISESVPQVVGLSPAVYMAPESPRSPTERESRGSMRNLAEGAEEDEIMEGFPGITTVSMGIASGRPYHSLCNFHDDSLHEDEDVVALSSIRSADPTINS